jgi:hypothetical protein
VYNICPLVIIAIVDVGATDQGDCFDWFATCLDVNAYSDETELIIAGIYRLAVLA